ncbi:phage antirepressor KilAC domain-containing protein [Pseudomonas sp. S2_B07]
MERTLAQAAKYFGMTRPKLLDLMRAKGLLNNRNLPAFPTRDRVYLRVKESNWYHESAGIQYSQSTRVKQPGLRWLADQLGLDIPAIPVNHSDVA